MSAGDVASDSFTRRCLIIGAVLMLVGLVLGAVGTHVVADRVSARQFASYETAVLYHLLHAIGLATVGLAARVTGITPALRWSARLMALGIACFSGSIYLVTMGWPHSLLGIAPAGGVAFMVAWALVALHALRWKRG